jgi:DNA-directed RNA polymerase specialized sigma24 family protein
VTHESKTDRLTDEFVSHVEAVDTIQNTSELSHAGTFEQHRPLLFAIAYRMLGSVADTEDLLQDTFIRWQQVPAVEVKSPRALLVTILTRLCINYLQAARLKYESYVGQWLPEPIATSPAVNPSMSLRLNESLSFGFLLLLQRLTRGSRRRASSKKNFYAVGAKHLPRAIWKDLLRFSRKTQFSIQMVAVKPLHCRSRFMDHPTSRAVYWKERNGSGFRRHWFGERPRSMVNPASSRFWMGAHLVSLRSTFARGASVGYTS